MSEELNRIENFREKLTNGSIIDVKTIYYKHFHEIKHVESFGLLINRLEKAESKNLEINIAYDKGYVDAMIAFAHWKDGVEYVGTRGDTLHSMLEKRKDVYNYDPPGLKK